jgi:hypothetical protein
MTSEGQTRSRPVVLKLDLKEFLSSYVKKFTMYIWLSTMKRNFSKHLDRIAEKIGIPFQLQEYWTKLSTSKMITSC